MRCSPLLGIVFDILLDICNEVVDNLHSIFSRKSFISWQILDLFRNIGYVLTVTKISIIVEVKHSLFIFSWGVLEDVVSGRFW